MGELSYCTMQTYNVRTCTLLKSMIRIMIQNKVGTRTSEKIHYDIKTCTPPVMLQKIVFQKVLPLYLTPDVKIARRNAYHHAGICDGLLSISRLGY